MTYDTFSEPPQISTSTVARHFIRVLPDTDISKPEFLRDPVGKVLCNVRKDARPSLGWMEANGELLSCKHYPDLFALIGFTYGNAPTIEVDAPMSPWEAFARAKLSGWLNMKPRAKIRAPNPSHKPGFFPLPDLRGQIAY